jgi:threonine dehydrogenase-like Zn-dependent dehydrogenase
VEASNTMGDELRRIAKYGFDVVIDCTGVASVMPAALSFVKSGGKLLVFGVCGPNDKVEISPFEIYRRDIEIIGSFAIRRTYDRAHKLMEAGVIDVSSLVAEILPLKDLERGLKLMKAGTAGMKLQVQL